MRRTSAIIGGVALATGLLVTPVAAAPSSHFSDTQSVVECGIESDAGILFAFAIESEEFGAFGDLSFAADPEAEDPDWVSTGVTVDFTETHVTATWDLVEFTGDPDDPLGDPVGTATLEAALVPAGDPVSFKESGGFGNQKFRDEGVVQAYTLDGSIDLPMGISFSPESCFASSVSFTSFQNSPASSVFHGLDFSMFCSWEVDGTFVNLFAFALNPGAEAQVSVFVGDEEVLFGAPTGDVVFTTEAFSASFDLFDTQEPSDEPVGSAEASATLTSAGRINERFQFDREKLHFTGIAYTVDGTLSMTTPDGTTDLAMDQDSCGAADTRSMQQTRPEPKKKPLANDAPEDALPIAVGDTVTVATTHSAVDPEEPCIDEFGEVPMSHTGWWRLEGTGGDVTIDSAGSDFDTVVGVYTEDGSELVQVGCVDQLEDSSQARITVATENGVTYWIQAGGFADETGTLVLSVE